MTPIKKELFQYDNYHIDTPGACVLYVMARDQRSRDNYALTYAQRKALELKLPLAVVFVLAKKGLRAREHYEFMLDGLRGVEADLQSMNIPFILLIGDPKSILANLFTHVKPAHVFMDFSPLVGPRKLAAYLSENTAVPISIIDTHNCVPVWLASNKQEVGARTLRPKIHKMLPDYLQCADDITLHPYRWPGTVMTMDKLKDTISDYLQSIQPNGQTIVFRSGEKAAHDATRDFMENRLLSYGNDRNNPAADGLSGLSPYFHYGQISVRSVLSLIAKNGSPEDYQKSYDTFVEEAVVRKELSDNFCYFGTSYKRLLGAPQWAQNTLRKHEGDPREFLYTLAEFEAGTTHDCAWNAAQRELIITGKMHGYMRMYWAKKVLEWSKSPEEAILTLIYLNDFYSIDGGDPNGYTGIMWSVAGVHDRPWGERPVYGTIRSMVYAGLKRKFDIKMYETKWLGA